MSNFDTAKWFKNQYLKEHKINEEDRATRVDKMLSGEYEDEDYKDSKRYDDVRAELAREDEGYDDEDIVIYDGEEHVIMSHDGNMVYIRPLEDSAILGKRDVIKVPVRALAYKSDLDKMFDKYEKMQTNEGYDWLKNPTAKDKEYLRKKYESWNKMHPNDQVDIDKALDGIEEGINEGFKVGDKVTYLGHPAVVTATEEYNDRDFVSVSYDKGNGATKARMILVKSGDVKAVKEDMNDPVLMKARAAKMADEKEMARQAALDKKYGSSFMNKLEAEIDLKNELQDLKDERAQLMIDMEQEAEPEGGEIADEYGSRLNDIDARMGEIKPELEDLRMYESINENREAIKETFRFIKENNPEFTNEEIKAELKEIKKLGNQLNEELCAKGKAYRKRRMAAGEKSSAYLSGRAVKVCKGQMSGKKKKK